MFALLAAITIFTGFEGGNLGRVETISPTHLRCAVKGEADQDGRNRQASWYYFRLDNLPASEIVIELTDLAGEYNYRPGTHPVRDRTRPVYSYDGNVWRHFTDSQVSWNEKDLRLTMRFTPEGSRMWIAHIPPYTGEHLERLTGEFRGNPYLTRESVGRTPGGREMPLWTITDPNTPHRGKKVVWLMCRQHAWESGTSWVGEGAVRFLLSEDPRAARIRDHTIFKIFPMADPDGVARGGVRFNAYGYDLNRNWDAVDPVKTPEIAAQRKAILAWLDRGGRIDIFLALHNTESGEFLEGPARSPVGGKLFALLRETTFNATQPLREQAASTTVGKPGRMSVNQALFHERKVPAFLMEQMIEFNKKLGRRPTTEDRLEFGAELARALAAAVAPKQ